MLPLLLIGGDAQHAAKPVSIHTRIEAYFTKPLVHQNVLEEVDKAQAGIQLVRLQENLGKTHQRMAAGRPTRVTQAQFDEALQELYVVYQPIIRAYDQSVFAYEALMRCGSSLLKTPADLLNASESLYRVDDLGRAVRRMIAETLRDRTEFPEPIFVNIHPSELRDEIFLAPDEVLLPFAPRIILEVTERAQLANKEQLAATLRALRAAGYRIALDDLGEGYAGLSWLIKLTPDVAKLDISLVRDIHKSRLQRQLVASLVSVCRRARTLVVAEGVETVREAEVLTDLGCDLLQGYLFARPGLAFPVPVRISATSEQV